MLKIPDKVLPQKLNIKNHIAEAEIAPTVKIYFSGMQNEGSHEQVVNGDSLSSGVYFFSIQGDNFKGTKKCLLIK